MRNGRRAIGVAELVDRDATRVGVVALNRTMTVATDLTGRPDRMAAAIDGTQPGWGAAIAETIFRRRARSGVDSIRRSKR